MSSDDEFTQAIARGPRRVSADIPAYAVYAVDEHTNTVCQRDHVSWASAMGLLQHACEGDAVSAIVRREADGIVILRYRKEGVRK